MAGFFYFSIFVSILLHFRQQCLWYVFKCFYIKRLNISCCSCDEGEEGRLGGGGGEGGAGVGGER